MLLGLSVSLSPVYKPCNEVMVWEKNVLFLLSFGFMFSSAFTNLNSLEKSVLIQVWIFQHELFHICPLFFFCFIFLKIMLSYRRCIFSEWVCLHKVCVATASFSKLLQFKWALSCSSAEHWLDRLFVLWLAQNHLAPFVWMLTHTNAHLFII